MEMDRQTANRIKWAAGQFTDTAEKNVRDAISHLNDLDDCNESLIALTVALRQLQIVGGLLASSMLSDLQ